MSTTTLRKSGWSSAYKAYLFDPHESLFLKVAPLLLLVGSPVIVVSNLVPVVGEAVDIGAFGTTLLVIFRTYLAIRKHHHVA